MFLTTSVSQSGFRQNQKDGCRPILQGPICQEDTTIQQNRKLVMMHMHIAQHVLYAILMPDMAAMKI